MRQLGSVYRLLLLLVVALGYLSDRTSAQELMASRDCSAYSYAPAFRAVPETYRARYRTIAHTFLDMERGLGGVTASKYAILDALIDEAKTRLRPIPETYSETEYRQFAIESLRTIDCILVSHGFVYPGKGLVQLLSDGLDPIFFSAAADYQVLLQESNNTGRTSFMNQRKPGPYYVVDCDIASFIYLAIAEVLEYPLAMVTLPRHNFVRWLLPAGGYINFETMDGKQTNDEYYRMRWAIPEKFLATPGVLSTMSGSQLLAYEYFGVGIAYTWKSDMNNAIAEYKKSIAVDGTSGDAANNLAWLYSVAPDKNFRHGRYAVRYAKQAVKALPIGDRLDTLACAYGTAGRFRKGVAAEERAIETEWAPYGSDLLGNLKLLKSGRPCEDAGFGIDPSPFRPSTY